MLALPYTQDQIHCIACNARICLANLFDDLQDKFSKGEVEDKECELWKLTLLSDKIKVLLDYYVAGSTIGTEVNASTTFLYTTNTYITTVTIGTTTVTVNANKTVAQLVSIINGMGYYCIIVSLAEADSGTFLLYVESPTCEGYAGIIGTNPDVPPPNIYFFIGSGTGAGCCTSIAPTPCLSDDMVMNLIGEIQKSCNC